MSYLCCCRSYAERDKYGGELNNLSEELERYRVRKGDRERVATIQRFSPVSSSFVEEGSTRKEQTKGEGNSPEC